MQDREPLCQAALRHMMNAVCQMMPPPRAVLIYGSHATGRAQEHSDLDVLVIGPQATDDIDHLVDALVEFSAHHGLALDDEVPYASKLLCSWDDLESAATCRVFADNAAARLLTPVRREASFLSSPAMRERLLVNVLVQPTVAWSEDVARLAAAQQRATSNILEVAKETLLLTQPEFTATQLVEVLIRSGDFTGKDYLGFMPDADTYHHLTALAINFVQTRHRHDRGQHDLTSGSETTVPFLPMAD